MHIFFGNRTTGLVSMTMNFVSCFFSLYKDLKSQRMFAKYKDLKSQKMFAKYNNLTSQRMFTKTKYKVRKKSIFLL